MTIIFTFFGLFTLWAVNAFICTELASNKCRQQYHKVSYFYDRHSVSKIFDWYDPFTFSSWLGFKHWFVKFPYSWEDDVDTKN